MKFNKTFYSFLLIISSLILLFIFNKPDSSDLAIEKVKKHNTEKASGAGISLDNWSFERSYPSGNISTSKYNEAFNHKKLLSEKKNRINEIEWQSLGPENIAGRILCLAFHPTNEDVIFVGSASSGLWKTTTQGVGRYAWEYVPTGFPVLGVAALAIDQNNPNTIYIGTGETYGIGFGEPVTVTRLIRGTYGIGILKSTDGGANWSKILEFDPSEIKGVQDIEINKLNSQEIYAATTDGLYQSLDGGSNWNLILNEPNCIDIEIDPNNGDIIYVTKGNLNLDLDPSVSGIYKSTNKGVSFTKLIDSGLIDAWSGNAKLALDPANSNTIYASIQMSEIGGNTTTAGIYKSINAGATWNRINNQNMAMHQGWYSQDLAINPQNNTEIMFAGFDSWKSTDTGSTFTQHSNWYQWDYGEISVDFPEGPDDYVHADVHGVYYHPINNKVFMVTDGGVFISDNGEQPFTTLNGGLQTTQFYSNIGSSSTNAGFCVGGLQDNGSVEYRGTDSWWRVGGADGLSAAVNQENDQIVYISSYNLNIAKSTDGGNSFSSAKPQPESGDSPAFSAPYELAPSNQNIVYGAGKYLYKSLDGGNNWVTISGQPIDGNNVIVKIGVSPINPNIVIVATTPDPFSNPSQNATLFKSVDGGQTFSLLTGLPDRICKDIAFDPNNDEIVYLTFSGFGSNHVYKSINGGTNWNSIDNGLPDLPTNTILVDPLNANDIYVGNDLGVYYSDNGGQTWDVFSEGLPEATMIYDLNNSPSNRKIRIATHGHGIWEKSFVNDPLSVNNNDLTINSFSIYPNPAVDKFTISIESDKNYNNITIEMYSIIGQKIEVIYSGSLDQGNNIFTMNSTSNYKSGTYFVTLTFNNKFKASEIIIIE